MTCGGCGGLGAHTRWCPTAVGARAHRYGATAAMLDDCGDLVGAADPGLANRCWALADQLTIKAETAAELHKAGQA